MSLKKIIIALSAEKFQGSWGHSYLETSAVALSSGLPVSKPPKKPGEVDSTFSPRVKVS